MTFKHLPNIISALRLVAVAPIVYLLMIGDFGWSLLLFTLAGLSDGLDGFLAKRYGWQSRLGGILDPLADKLLLVCCFLVLGALGLIPVWLVVAAVFRDLLIVGGAVLYNFGIEVIEAAPLPVSKLNTLVQLLLVVVVILDAGVLSLPDVVLSTLVWLCLATTLVSGVQYIWIWGGKALARGWHDS